MPVSLGRPRDLDGPHAGMDALFHPRAVAVLGASGREANPFARPLHYLAQFGFAGDLYPVNPGYAELAGMRCYPSLAALPGPVDLVLMLIPAARVLEELPAVAAAGARAAVVFASGFGEMQEGQALQEQLRDTARRLGVRLLGPNCQGVIHTGEGMFGTFTAALESGPVATGGLAYVGQSGAVGGSILSLARERGLGIAAWASTGNQADLTAVELARYLVEEDETRVLALYLETAVNDHDFRDLARRVVQLEKKLVVLRSAVSPAGARAAASHTGAIVGDDAGYRVTVREFGVIEAEDIDDFVALAHGLTISPPIAGERIAVVTTSGGAGSLAADQLSAVGFSVDNLPEQTRAELRTVVPGFGAVDNPVDVTAQIFRDSDPSAFVGVCDRVYRADGIDAVMITLTLVTGKLATRMAESFVATWRDLAKPVLVVWMAGREQTAEARDVLRDAGWPVFDSTRQAARVLAALRNPKVVEEDLDPTTFPVNDVRHTVAGFGATVTESEGEILLGLAGVARPGSILVRSVDQAEALAAQVTGSRVLKIQASRVLHKSERGGVRLGVPAGQLVRTYRELMASFEAEQPAGVLVQETAPAGVELIVGVTRPTGGLPIVTVGLGGYATEIYRDAVSAFAPVSPQRAEQMVRSLTAAPLLTGFRGSPPVDLSGAAQAISRISLLAVAIGERLSELEVNPLRVTPDGRAIALDFLLLQRPAAMQVPSEDPEGEAR
ncbi:acetate--CoA ligase family protein [Micromonospora sp. NPDC050686]|uniref:acetate--CoA ligase family protein n=1 Tax=Micromonospora sp. NPDC050686 TaxID=3154631 RepID=UPI003409BE4F